MSSDHSDNELTMHWQNLNTSSGADAMKSIFFRLYDDLFQYAFRLTGSNSLAKDAIQNCFTDLWQYRQNLDLQAPVRAYLFTSVRNHCIKLLKQERKQKDIAEKIKFEADDITLHLELHDNEKRFTSLLNQLSPRQREIFFLRYSEDLSFKEIAMILDIRYQSVLNHSHKAIKRLRDHLKKKNN